MTTMKMRRINAYGSSEKETVEIIYLGVYQNMFIPGNSSAGRCSIKKEFREPLNWGRTAKNGPILKMD